MNNYDELDLSLIKQSVSNNASFEMSRDYILNEEVSFNPIVIRDNLRKTKEAMKIISLHGRFEFTELKDISMTLSSLKKGLTLTSFELLEVYEHNAEVRRIARYFRSVDEIDELTDFTESLFYNDELMHNISSKIDTSGEVKHNASERLQNLYAKSQSVDARINETAREFIRNNASSMQESLLYYRNNRACFLLKNTDKNKYDGYTYGNSSSGLASYVEPRVMIALNNEKNDVEEDIKEEINRILYNLSLEVSRYADKFIDNLDSLMKLDAIFTKAYFGYERHAVLAELSSGELYIEESVHPLIDEKKAVYNTYRLKRPDHGIVISGSNTGGKTVSLKLIGISVLLTYLGIPLIATKALIPLYDNVFIDMNDTQSIVDSLSTFSSRLVSINKILERFTSKSLVLIDEIASGTDPKEGEALALAIIEKLNNDQTTFVVTTHFSKVKKYALQQDGILTASQTFDSIKLQPTYKYIENSLGQSNGLDIAKRYLKHEDVLIRAREIYTESETKEESLIKELEKEKEEILKIKSELEEKLIRQKEMNDTLEKEMANLGEMKYELEKEAKEKINRYVEEQKEKARHIIKRIKKEALKEHEAIKLSAKLDNLIDDDKVISTIEEIKPGDNVIVISTSQVGKVEEIKKDRVTILVNGINLKTTLDNLKKTNAFKEDTTKKRKHVDKNYRRVNRELVLVGERCEDAIEILSKYLDDAYGCNLKTVKIIHGYGTGQLRKAIFEYLKKNKLVKNYHLADAYDGGSGATIVEFK